MHDHFVNAYIVARGDIIAIAEHMGISPLEALRLAAHPDVAPLLDQFVKLERTRHFLASLIHQTDAAETLHQLTKVPAERPRAALAHARLTIAMAAAARPPRERVPRPIRASRSDVPNNTNAQTSQHSAPGSIPSPPTIEPKPINQDAPTDPRSSAAAGAYG